MAEQAHNVMGTESLITSADTPKPKAKRSRPKKAGTSLTRTTRRSARSKAGSRSKAVPPAPPITILNRLLNFSVIIAVFVTALAIQRIVPTEPVSTPRVEALQIQPAEAPTTAAQAPASAPAAVSEPATIATPATPIAPTAPTTTAGATATTEVPKVAVTQSPIPEPVAQKPAAASQRFIKKAKVAVPKVVSKPKSHATPLNSGGTEDLDSESARQTYISKSKLATRTPTK